MLKKILDYKLVLELRAALRTVLGVPIGLRQGTELGIALRLGMAEYWAVN